MDKYYLLKSSSNFSDEFDMKGFIALDEKEYNEYLTCLNEFEIGFRYCEYDFGTNEYMVFETKEDVLKTFSIEEISKSQYDALVSLNLERFGIIPAYKIIMDKDYWNCKSWLNS